MKMGIIDNERVKIEKIVPGGQGLGSLSDGRKIFLWNVLPQEEVTEFLVTKKKSKYLEGIATKIENPSKFRVKERDECFLSTSPWQIFDYQFELEQKAEVVKECFRQNGIEIEAPEVMTDGKEWNYRNKMEYSLFFDKEKEQIELAFHQRGSHSKIPIKQSSIERPEIYEAAQKIVLELNERREEARKYQSLVLRCSRLGEVSGGLYENGKPHPVFPVLSDEILGISYNYSPNGFFQINLPVYELALLEIKKEVEDSSKVLDLYSGVGTIGLSVARDKKLTLVECDKSAYRELERNCAVIDSEALASFSLVREKFSDESSQKDFLGHSRELVQQSVSGRDVRSARCYGRAPSSFSPVGSEDSREQTGCSADKYLNPVPAKSEEALEYIAPDTTVIVDPPRAGCDKKLLEKILEVEPPKIIYLSCNPVTQARDVAILAEKYIIKGIKSFNFFPKTPHIENLVVLEKK